MESQSGHWTSREPGFGTRLNGDVPKYQGFPIPELSSKTEGSIWRLAAETGCALCRIAPLLAKLPSCECGCLRIIVPSGGGP